MGQKHGIVTAHFEKGGSFAKQSGGFLKSMPKNIISAPRNQLRIIGGRWRGRKINFPDLPSLKPTPDRVRETLFNWLMNDIQDAVCLDLFAGSGALGFEALSRGASAVLMVDESSKAIKAIEENAKRLDTQQMIAACARIPADLTPFLQQRFNIVFLDPPYRQGLLQDCCSWLERSGNLAEQALIYLEAEKTQDMAFLPEDWQLLKSKIAGQVGYHLARRG